MEKEPTKFFTPADGKPVVVRFLDKGEKHVNPISIGGPCNRSNVVKIPATPDTIRVYKEGMRKAWANEIAKNTGGTMHNI